jgi:hypothetical protein
MQQSKKLRSAPRLHLRTIFAPVAGSVIGYRLSAPRNGDTRIGQMNRAFVAEDKDPVCARFLFASFMSARYQWILNVAIDKQPVLYAER